ncbi:MAG: hypothetical protein ACRDOD_17225 [Streptosporangiaceae bacterium]
MGGSLGQAPGDSKYRVPLAVGQQVERTVSLEPRLGAGEPGGDRLEQADGQPDLVHDLWHGLS